MKKAYQAMNVYFFDQEQAAAADQIVFYGMFGIVSAIVAGVCMVIA